MPRWRFTEFSCNDCKCQHMKSAQTEVFVFECERVCACTFITWLCVGVCSVPAECVDEVWLCQNRGSDIYSENMYISTLYIKEFSVVHADKELVLVKICAQRLINLDCDWSCRVIGNTCLCLRVHTVTMMAGDGVTLGLVLTNYLLIFPLS